MNTMVAVSGDGAKSVTGNVWDGSDLSADCVLSWTLNSVAPIVSITGLSFESTVTEGGYPKISNKDFFDQLQLEFQADKDGTYYVKLDSTAFTNGLLVTSGLCSAGVPKIVPMFTQDLTGVGARDGLHDLTVYVKDEYGNIGSA